LLDLLVSGDNHNKLGIENLLWGGLMAFHGVLTPVLAKKSVYGRRI